MKVVCDCGASYNLGPKYAGRKVKCKKCTNSFLVPGAPGGRPKTAAELKREREDALLSKHAKEYDKRASTAEFIENNFKDAIEEARSNWAMASIGSGILIIVIGLILGWYMWQFEGGYTWAVIAYLMYAGGQYWVAPLFFAVGTWRIITGASELIHVAKLKRERKKKKKKA